MVKVCVCAVARGAFGVFCDIEDRLVREEFPDFRSNSKQTGKQAAGVKSGRESEA